MEKSFNPAGFNPGTDGWSGAAMTLEELAAWLEKYADMADYPRMMAAAAACRELDDRRKHGPENEVPSHSRFMECDHPACRISVGKRRTDNALAECKP